MNGGLSLEYDATLRGQTHSTFEKELDFITLL